MLRTLHESDAEAICQINATALGYPRTVEQTSEQLNKLLADNHHFFVGFEHPSNQQIIGYLHAQCYESLYSDTGFNILGLAVLAEFQQQGIGKQLLAAVEAEARKRNYSFIRLNSGSTRKGAHAFYRKMGYEGDKTQLRFIKQL